MVGLDIEVTRRVGKWSYVQHRALEWCSGTDGYAEACADGDFGAFESAYFVVAGSGPRERVLVLGEFVWVRAWIDGDVSRLG